MQSVNKDKLELALKSDLEILYSALGHYSVKDEIGMAPKSRQKLKEIGKEWFLKRKKEIEIIICRNKAVVSQFIEPETGIGDSLTLGLLIGDLLISKYGGIPAIYISSIILKLGLNNFCNDLRK